MGSRLDPRAGSGGLDLIAAAQVCAGHAWAARPPNPGVREISAVARGQERSLGSRCDEAPRRSPSPDPNGEGNGASGRVGPSSDQRNRRTFRRVTRRSRRTTNGEAPGRE